MTYTIKLINPEKKLRATIEVADDEYIYDVAEREGINIPVSCRAGACITCTGRLIEGKVDQDHHFLKPHEIDAGFVLTCRAKPLSNCVILTHQEDALLYL